jgi:hypothetical protein
MNNHRKNRHVAWHVVLAPEARHLYRKPAPNHPLSPSGATYFGIHAVRLVNVFLLIIVPKKFLDIESLSRRKPYEIRNSSVIGALF